MVSPLVLREPGLVRHKIIKISGVTLFPKIVSSYFTYRVMEHQSVLAEWVKVL
jgi:hypothetical protein